MIENAPGCNCTGCSACVSICPVSAITLIPNTKGFVVPRVDEQKCIKCKKCLTVCPSLSPLSNEPYDIPSVYAAWNKDEVIRINSTSGGVFSALAQTIIQQGGYVVGAEYTSDFSVHHTIIKSTEQIQKQRQSKYTQSNLNLVFRDIKALLDNDNLVLFCGTPCQSAGLQKYLGKEYVKLFCCDFICRGVISPKVYKKFLTDMTPNSEMLKEVQFKNKDFGWNRFSTKLTFSNDKTYHRDRNDDYYMRGYLQHNLYLRNCCYQCDYKSLPRISDISLGDFWGIGNYETALDNEQGTSVILVNSDKGQSLLNLAAEYLELTERSLDEVLAGNSCLLQSATRGEYRDYFFKKMNKMSFSKLIETIDRKSLKLSHTERVLRTLSILKHHLKGDY